MSSPARVNLIAGLGIAHLQKKHLNKTDKKQIPKKLSIGNYGVITYTAGIMMETPSGEILTPEVSSVSRISGILTLT